MAGLSAAGLTIKDLETLLSEIVADQLANMDAGLNTEADSLLGQLNAIYAAALFDLWELLEEIYQAGYPDTATGQALSNIAALTGTLREPATKSTANVRFHGPDTTVVPAGTEVYIVGRPESRFETLIDWTIDGDLFVDADVSAITAGTETYALAGDAVAMPNPPANVTTPTLIIANGVLGEDEETDGALRVRRELELAQAGKATVDAIRADLLDVAGVDKAQVYENTTDTTDVNGLPPYSIECLVYSENAPTYAAQDVVDAVWNAKPAGTPTFGGLSGTANDAAGDPHTVYYSEPTSIRTYIEIEYDYDSTATDYVGADAVKDAVVLWALQNLSMGDDVYASDVIALVSGLSGILSVDGTTTECDDVTPTATKDLAISLREVASVAKVDITVTENAV